MTPANSAEYFKHTTCIRAPHIDGLGCADLPIISRRDTLIECRRETWLNLLQTISEAKCRNSHLNGVCDGTNHPGYAGSPEARFQVFHHIPKQQFPCLRKATLKQTNRRARNAGARTLCRRLSTPLAGDRQRLDQDNLSNVSPCRVMSYSMF